MPWVLVLSAFNAWAGTWTDHPTELRAWGEAGVALQELVATPSSLTLASCSGGTHPIDPMPGGVANLVAGLPFELPAGCWRGATLVLTGPILVKGTTAAGSFVRTLPSTTLTVTLAEAAELDVSEGGATATWGVRVFPAVLVAAPGALVLGVVHD